jgi:hypothetical protein
VRPGKGPWLPLVLTVAAAVLWLLPVRRHPPSRAGHGSAASSATGTRTWSPARLRRPALVRQPSTADSAEAFARMVADADVDDARSSAADDERRQQVRLAFVEHARLAPAEEARLQSILDTLDEQLSEAADAVLLPSGSDWFALTVDSAVVAYAQAEEEIRGLAPGAAFALGQTAFRPVAQLSLPTRRRLLMLGWRVAMTDTTASAVDADDGIGEHGQENAGREKSRKRSTSRLAGAVSPSGPGWRRPRRLLDAPGRR